MNLRTHRTPATATTQPPLAPPLGHVTLQSTPVPVAGAADDWERMHVALAAWKARSLLIEARNELRKGVRHDTDPRLVAQLWRAEGSVAAALADLQELDHV